MAFDLDEDELKATREMHKLSDKNVAKDDIHKLNKFCEYEDAVVLCEEALYEIQEAIERILSEREQDKKKIKELEGETLLISPYYVKQNYIPKRKVEDELEALRKMLKVTMSGKLQEYTVEEIIIKINTLEELLEEGD